MVECPICGNHSPAENQFCGSCGGRLIGATGLIDPNTILEGRYLIIKLVGRGGMGAVYKALDKRQQNRVVAIKEMSTNAVGSDNYTAAVDAFEREAGMLNNLDSPALPRVWDFFPGNHHRLYLVMDYIEGESLEAAIQRCGPIPESMVIDWARQICDVLHYLHSYNPPIIFRDLKPSNIMLTPQGKIKLIDFGIARHFKPGQSTDTVTYGSIGFSAPEQYGQGQTDARSDIYSLGATLYYLLTGINPSKNPFQFEPVGNFIEVSPPLAQAIHWALQLKPDERPASVREWMNLLDFPYTLKKDADDTVLLSSNPDLTTKLPPSDASGDPTVVIQKPGRQFDLKFNFKREAAVLALLLLLFAVWFGFSTDDMSILRGTKPVTRDDTNSQPASQQVNEIDPIQNSALEAARLPAVEDKKLAKKESSTLKKIYYQEYKNERFGYSIEYPREFKTGAPPENGDGRGVSSLDGEARLIIYGANVLYDESLEDVYKASKEYVREIISYQQKGNNWFVLSWKKDNYIYYLKTFVGQGSANSFIFSYPEAEKQYYDQVTIHLESTFHPGDVNNSR